MKNKLCRICFGKYNLLKTECDCKGSIGWIHISCFKKWYKIKKNITCEICKNNILYNYLTIKQIILLLLIFILSVLIGNTKFKEFVPLYYVFIIYKFYHISKNDFFL
jgi:E3 ubiquitin-protein ligase DOA10